MFVLGLPFIFFQQWKKNALSTLWKRVFPIAIPPVEGHHPIIWIHAVSLGETIAIQELIHELQKKYPLSSIITSHVTVAGLDASIRLYPEAHAHVFLPFEFSFLYHILLKNIPKVEMLIYSEGDVWPLFTQIMKTKKATVAVVNGKLSTKSYNRYKKLLVIARKLFQDVDLFCVQNELFFDRFLALGIPKNKLIVTGSIKADCVKKVMREEERVTFFQEIPALRQLMEPTVLFASTHDPEEIELLSRYVMAGLLYRGKVIVVPRHSYRFEEVYQLLKTSFPLLRVLLLDDPLQTQCVDWDILIINRMGLLEKLYQFVVCSVVCGSFVEHIGGHNILEPASYGCPFIVGPYMHSQPLLIESAKNADAVLQAAGYDDALYLINSMMNDVAMRKQQSARVYDWALSMRGAVRKTVEALQNYSEKDSQ